MCNRFLFGFSQYIDSNSVNSLYKDVKINIINKVYDYHMIMSVLLCILMHHFFLENFNMKNYYVFVLIELLTGLIVYLN